MQNSEPSIWEVWLLRLIWHSLKHNVIWGLRANCEDAATRPVINHAVTPHSRTPQHQWEHTLHVIKECEVRLFFVNSPDVTRCRLVDLQTYFEKMSRNPTVKHDYCSPEESWILSVTNRCYVILDCTSCRSVLTREQSCRRDVHLWQIFLYSQKHKKNPPRREKQKT